MQQTLKDKKNERGRVRWTKTRCVRRGWACVWPAAVRTGPMAGSGGCTADTNSEGDPADETGRGRWAWEAAGMTVETGRERGEEVLDGIRLQ